jgi:hypothetical protein
VVASPPLLSVPLLIVPPLRVVPLNDEVSQFEQPGVVVEPKNVTVVPGVDVGAKLVVQVWQELAGPLMVAGMTGEKFVTGCTKLTGVTAATGRNVVIGMKLVCATGTVFDTAIFPVVAGNMTTLRFKGPPNIGRNARTGTAVATGMKVVVGVAQVLHGAGATVAAGMTGKNVVVGVAQGLQLFTGATGAKKVV